MTKHVYLVTGASSGIGKVVAERLNQKGNIVYGLARRLEAMQDLQAKGVRIRSVDVTQDDQLSAVIDEIITQHGRIDGLINNAGGGIYGALEETPISEAKALFELNVFAYARAIQLVLPHMRERRSGHIINISSVVGFIVIPSNGWYCASKFAIEALTDSLRMEVRHLGIGVSLINPEVINTGFGGPAVASLGQISSIPDYAFLTSNWEKMIPEAIARGASPQLVAKAVLKALRRKRPKARYFVPAYARLFVWTDRVLPQHWQDWIILTLLKYRGK